MTGFFLKMLYAFLVGGFLCAVAQILTAVGIYAPLVEFAGNGATTPLTGFGYSLAKGVEKAVDERGLIGAMTGGITGTAGGITAAMFFGLIAALIFRGKPK